MTDSIVPITIMSDDETIDVLLSSLYPGAKRESAYMVLKYCRAARLDPIQKPVHIVPMRVKTGEKDGYGNDQYAMRDTVMPGIGLYRTQAARTGLYAGQDAPVYGPMMELPYKRKVIEWRDPGDGGKKKKIEHWEDAVITFPEFIEVTIYKFVSGVRVAFTAQEFWIENYATAGRDTDAPNEMWSKRTRAQLKKCTEAAALRMAFPEAVGANPTAEEMEGRYVEVIENDEGGAEVKTVKTPARKSDKDKAPAPDASAPAASPTAAADQTKDVEKTKTEPAGEPDSRPEPPIEGITGDATAEVQAKINANAPKTDEEKAARLAEAKRVAEKVGAPLKNAAEVAAPPPAAAPPAAPSQAPAQQASNGINTDDDGVLAGKGERSYLYKRTVGRGMDMNQPLSEAGFTNVKVGTEKEPFTGLTETQFNYLVDKHIKAK